MDCNVSVIVPIFNAEKYLSRCIDSILSQTFKNFELILVNDGSTDNSLEICKKYKNQDNRIRLISGANCGSSIARNMGLDLAKGEYVIHMDSDDWAEKNMLSKLYYLAKQKDADICACGFVFDDGMGKTTKKIYPYIEEKHKDIYRLNSLYSSVWNKLVKKELYILNNIRFVPGVTMMDDWVVTTRLRYFSKKTVIIKECLYHYFTAPRVSITTKSSYSYPYSQIHVVEFLENYFKNQIKNDEVLRKTLGGIKLRAKYNILKYPSLGGVTKWRNLYQDSHKYIISCSEHPKAKLIMILALILPDKIFRRIAYHM